METYLIVLLLVLFIDIIGKGLILKDGAYNRNPNHVLWDLAVNLVLLAWGVHLLTKLS